MILTNILELETFENTFSMLVIIIADIVIIEDAIKLFFGNFGIHTMISVNTLLGHQIEFFSLENLRCVFNVSFGRLLTCCSKLELMNWKLSINFKLLPSMKAMFMCFFSPFFTSKTIFFGYFDDLLHDKVIVITSQIMKYDL